MTWISFPGPAGWKERWLLELSSDLPMFTIGSTHTHTHGGGGGWNVKEKLINCSSIHNQVWPTFLLILGDLDCQAPYHWSTTQKSVLMTISLVPGQNISVGTLGSFYPHQLLAQLGPEASHYSLWGINRCSSSPLKGGLLYKCWLLSPMPSLPVSQILHLLMLFTTQAPFWKRHIRLHTHPCPEV